MADFAHRNKAVDEWIAGLTPELEEIASSLRQVILEVEPAITESIKWSRPVYSGKGNICSIDPAKDHLNLGFFDGASLPDPSGLLEGTGKNHRHIKVKRLSDIRKKEFCELVKSSVLHDMGESQVR